MTLSPYNPLEKLNLAKSIEVELLSHDAIPLSDTSNVRGAGVYVIYYTGGFPPYAPIASRNAGRFTQPIYIGKAIPKGGRKGGLGADASKGRAMADRLNHHRESIDQVSNLSLVDFHVRYLMLDDIWIPLAENMLIETFKPVWNRAIDGFGNKDPGMRRRGQYKSPWDVLHTGRKAMEKLADSGMTAELLVARIEDYFAGRTLAKLPRVIVEQEQAGKVEAEEAADEI